MERATMPNPPLWRAMVFQRRHGGPWYAECLDLSLAVSRPTPEAAIRVLQEQVDLHASTVVEEHLPADLLHRPSPRRHWFLYWILVATSRLRPLVRFAAGWRTLRITAPLPLHA